MGAYASKISLAAAILLLLLGLAWVVLQDEAAGTITPLTYEECAMAGGKISPTTPRTCTTLFGITYSEGEIFEATEAASSAREDGPSL